MKRLIAAVLALLLLLGIVGPAFAMEIPDEEPPGCGVVGITSEPVAYMSGYGDGSFRPDQYLTRAEACAVIYRIMSDGYRNIFYSEVTGFLDIPEDAWCLSYIATLESAGLLDWADCSIFGPNEYITRSQMAAILSGLIVDDELDAGMSVGRYEDMHGHWAEDAVIRTCIKGWMCGVTEMEFQPEGYLTRGEFCHIVNQMLNRKQIEGDILSCPWSDVSKFHPYFSDIALTQPVVSQV